MARRTVLRRGGMIATFGATIDACADKVGEGFRSLTDPFLQPGEQPPNVTLVIQLLGRMIAGGFETLLDLDRADFDERANDKAPRSLRDRLTDELHTKLVQLRLLVQLAFGEDYARTLVPITGNTASAPPVVYRQGEHTLARLLDPSAEKLESQVAGVDPDLAQWAGEIEPLVTQLGETLVVIEEERTKASQSVRRKSDTMKDLDFYYSHAYAILRSFLFLAGLPKAAKELPTLNRTRRSLRGPDPRGTVLPGEDGEGGEEPSDPSDTPSTETPLEVSAPEADLEGAGSQDSA